MGNNFGIKQILDKHKKLAEKEVRNKYPDVDLLFFNIPITFEYVRQLSLREDNIKIYKHFDFIEDVQDTEPNELIESLNAITNYENEIKLLEIKIKQEKQKILNLDYIKSKFNRQVLNKKEYIETIKYISKKYFNGSL